MSDTISSVEETVVNGDIVTKVTETKTINQDHSITTTTTVDKTDHADEDNHITSISQITSSSPDLDQKIIRQIEYYFSDMNMIRDQFLQSEVTKDNGWIPLSILTTFKRLQSLTTDFPTIINALKKSLSGLLQLHETEHKIRRHPNRPLATSQAELELTLKNRTVFVQGFPKGSNVTLDQLLEFFERYGATDNIQMKKEAKTKDFIGSVWVIFPTEEKAQEFVENCKEKSIKYDDGSILECSLQDYKGREREKQVKKEKKQEELQKKTNEHLEKLNSENLTGALIHLTGMAANTTRELIKAKFNPFTKMPWIDFNRGDSEAWVRLNEANTAKDVLNKVLTAGEGKIVIGDNEVTSRIVEGEEETQFWKEANEKRAAQRTHKNERYTNGTRARRIRQKRQLNQDRDNQISTEAKKSKDFSAD